MKINKEHLTGAFILFETATGYFPMFAKEDEDRFKVFEELTDEEVELLASSLSAMLKHF